MYLSIFWDELINLGVFPIKISISYYFVSGTPARISAFTSVLELTLGECSNLCHSPLKNSKAVRNFTKSQTYYSFCRAH